MVKYISPAVISSFPVVNITIAVSEPDSQTARQPDSQTLGDRFDLASSHRCHRLTSVEARDQSTNLDDAIELYCISV
jgi:hypothetical protein